MSKLKLSWADIKIVKEQIEAAEAGVKMGRTGMITITSEDTVEWDSFYVTLELPGEE